MVIGAGTAAERLELCVVGILDMRAMKRMRRSSVLWARYGSTVRGVRRGMQVLNGSMFEGETDSKILKPE